MSNPLFIAALAGICLSLAGCATITRGTTEQVNFTSEPSGAAMRTSSGLTCPTTPCTLEISRKQAFIATFSMPGYESRDIEVTTDVAGTGAAGFAGNVVLGGVIGMGTDVATGATLNHSPNPVHAILTKAAAARSEANRDVGPRRSKAKAVPAT